jgi:phosphoserine phosphatase
MHVETAPAVIGRIAAAVRERPGGAIAFDADGTLWSGDVGDDFFHSVLASGRVEAAARVAMRALAEVHGVRAPEGGAKLGAALFEAYREGRVPEDSFCEMVAYVCAGWTTGEVEVFAAEVVARSRVSERTHAETARIVDWARRERVEAFVVSASPFAVVVQAARPLGFGVENVLAVTPVLADGRVAADVHRPIPYGEGKVTRLAERLGARPLYAAFGDNRFDIPLLRAAEIAVAVRPKRRLLERAAEVPGMVEMR